MISADGIIVLSVLFFMLVSFYLEYWGPALTLVISVAVMGVFGILTPNEILSGFANEQVVVIIMLLLVGEIIKQANIIDPIFDRVLRGGRSRKGFLWRMMTIVAALSAFMNNTPLVAVMMPYVHSWGKRHRVAMSKLLMPLSFAAILGGCATLIGTSTNLIVNGLLAEQTIYTHLRLLDIFDFTIVGAPMIVVGMIYLLLFGDRLLPSKGDPVSDFTRNSRQYIVEAQVRKGSHLIGLSIGTAGLRNLKGLYLFEIQRGGQTSTAVGPEVVLEEDDILVFTGDTRTISELLDARSGLSLPGVGQLSRKKQAETVEIVISHNSALIDKTVKEANFRSKYDSAIIAIHRNGEKLSGKIGNIKLKAGDLLLLFAGPDMEAKAEETHDFYYVSRVRSFSKLELWKAVLLLGGTAFAIGLATVGVVSLFMAIMFLLIVLLLTRIASPKDLSKRIDYNLAVIIALSLALGTAMVNSGLADLLADIMITYSQPLGVIGLLLGIYIITALLAAYITNKAAVAIIFPISLTIAHAGGYPPMPFVLLVAFAAAANFMTPVGYQTNLMVYGPGGYSFRDFMRVGLPLTVLYMLVAVGVLYWVYFLPLK